MTAPPVLTPERIDAMLSILAEVCLESVVEAGRRQQAAEDDEAFERCGRSLQGAARGLRQTIALKQRFDRGQAALADEDRRRAETVRQDAERAHQKALTAKRAAVRSGVGRLVWDEDEQDDALALKDEISDRLHILAEDPGFLDAPLEELVQRLADQVGLYDEDEETPEPLPEAPPPQAPPPQAPPSHRGERRDHAENAEPPEIYEPSASPAQTSAVSAVESDGSAVPAVTAPPPPPDPPPRPPAPPPQLYIPPWEHLRAGERMPGGSGW